MTYQSNQSDDASLKPLATLTAEQVAMWARKAGGIVHGDGNMFFTNHETFMTAARACVQTQSPEQCTAQHPDDYWIRQYTAARRSEFALRSEVAVLKNKLALAERLARR